MDTSDARTLDLKLLEALFSHIMSNLFNMKNSAYSYLIIFDLILFYLFYWVDPMTSCFSAGCLATSH